MQDVLTVTLSATEATFLAALLGSDVLIGVPDPLEGLLAEQIREKWGEARKSLAGRGYIRVAPEGKVLVDTPVAAVINTWSGAEAVLLATCTRPEGTVTVRHFLTRHMVIQQQESGGLYTNERVGSASEIPDRLLKRLGLDNCTAAPGVAHKLTESDLLAAQQFLSINERAIEAENTEDAQLGRGVAYGSITAMSRQATTWAVYSLGFLLAETGLYRLRAHGADPKRPIEAIPSDSDQLANEVAKLVYRVQPVPGE